MLYSASYKWYLRSKMHHSIVVKVKYPQYTAKRAPSESGHRANIFSSYDHDHITIACLFSLKIWRDAFALLQCYHGLQLQQGQWQRQRQWPSTCTSFFVFCSDTWIGVWRSWDFKKVSGFAFLCPGDALFNCCCLHCRCWAGDGIDWGFTLVCGEAATVIAAHGPSLYFNDLQCVYQTGWQVKRGKGWCDHNLDEHSCPYFWVLEHCTYLENYHINAVSPELHR